MGTKKLDLLRLLIGAILAGLAAVLCMPVQAGQSILVRATEPSGTSAWEPSPSDKVVSDLSEALELARVARRSYVRGASIVITLQAGVHRVKEAVHLGPEDSGTLGAPLIIRGENSAVRLSGAVKLSPAEIRLDSARAEVMGLPTASRQLLETFVLPTEVAGVNKRDIARRLGERSGPMPFEIFDEVGPLHPARWPNTGFAIGKPGGKGIGSVSVAAKDSRRVRKWALSPAPWIVGYLHHDYSHVTLPIAGFDVEDGQVFLGPEGSAPVAAQARYAVQHVASELDQPGEWIGSREGSLVHVIPRSGSSTLEVSVARNLLLLEGTRHIRIEGLVLERSRGGAVRVENSHGIVFASCSVRDTGGVGIELLRTTDSRIDRCRFENVGEEGVRLGGGERTTLTPGRNSVTDSRFERFSRLARSYHPGVAITGVGQSIVGNFFKEAPHAAIIFSGNEHLIERNEIKSVVQECSDCGAIYAYRDWTARGTVIRNNYLHDVQGDTEDGAGRDVKGIYLDDFTSGITVSGNVLLRVEQGVFIGGGRDNLIERNIFAASEPAIHVDGRGLTWAREAISNPEGELRGNFSAVPVRSPVWLARYPSLADILLRDPARPTGNRVIGNLFAVKMPLRLLDEVRRSDVEITGISGAEAAPASIMHRFAGARKVKELRALGADQLISYDLTGLPLERMDRDERLRKPVGDHTPGTR